MRASQLAMSWALRASLRCPLAVWFVQADAVPAVAMEVMGVSPISDDPKLLKRVKYAAYVPI